MKVSSISIKPKKLRIFSPAVEQNIRLYYQLFDLTFKFRVPTKRGISYNAREPEIEKNK